MLAPLADELGLTIKVFGTPAEEGGDGKIIMFEKGVFDGLHAVMRVRSTPHDDVADPHLTAAAFLSVGFTGRTADAAAAVHKGINAADAFTVAQVGIEFLRAHLPAKARVNGILTEGGIAPNVVPAHTAGRYVIRAASLSELEEVRRRVEDCFPKLAHWLREPP